MNNNQTIEKLRQMRLGPLPSCTFSDMTADEYLTLLIDPQWEDRQNRKINRFLKQAGFRQQASFADVTYTHNRDLDKNMVLRLASLDFIDRNEKIII